MARATTYTPLLPSDIASAFPNSRKVYVEERGLRVPMRGATQDSLSFGNPFRMS
jgi:hypothetical protein